jgi:phosphotriesterase-related protein
MATVATVRGPVDAADLGRTYMHEHIFVLTTEVQQNFPDGWGDEDARVDDAVEKLRALAAGGVRTIVDPTVIGLGRYIPRIQRVAAQVPELNVVVATGCYTYHDVPFFFHYRTPEVGALLGRAEPEPMVPMFVADITEGIAGTGVRAGMLKCAIDKEGMTPGVERVMRAVARTHLATGCPITVHTHPGTERGLEVHRVMAEEGVDPRAVVLGHSGDSTDAEHLSALAEAGYWLGMDRFGINLETTFEDRADVVVELCRRGLADAMVLSHDAACYIDWIDPGVLPMLPQWHYLHIEQEVLPYLRAHGVTEEQITTMLVDNPRNILAGP